MAVRLLCVRHAPTRAEGLCVGQTDLRTTISAYEAARAIEVMLEAPPRLVYSSPLCRCAGPARWLAVRYGVTHRLDERLLEIDYGEWDGRSWEELGRVDGARFAYWLEHWREAAPPGGERLAEFEARVRDWWSERCSWDEGPHLLVAHAGVLRVLRVLAGESWEQALRTPVEHLKLEEPFAEGVF